MAKGIATRYLFAGRRNECVEINGLRYTPRIRFVGIKAINLDTNNKGEVLYALRNSSEGATEKELREFHERLRA